MKKEDKEEDNSLKVTKKNRNREEKKTVNNLIGLFEKQEILLQKQNKQSKSNVELGEVPNDSINIQQPNKYTDGGTRNMIQYD